MNIKRTLGFTLIETIIAIALFMAVLVAVLAVSGNILIATRSQNLDVTAQYLLQEGIEYVRNNRDSALNSNATWAQFTNSGGGSCPLTIGADVVSLCPCISSGGTASCSVDPIFNKVGVCPISGCPNIVKATNSGRTIYCTRVGTGTICPSTAVITEETTFSRSIRLIPSVNVDEMYVEVTVSWADNNGVPRTKTIKTTLFNW